MTNVMMERTGSPAYTWLLALTYVCFLLNHVAHAQLNWRTPLENLTGATPDISPLLRFHWWEEVYYKIDDSDFPSDSQEARGRFVGIAEHVGHAMTYSILTDDTLTTIRWSNVRSARITDAPNLKADIFSGEAKEQFISSKISENGQGTEDNRLVIIQPEDLIGWTTFLTAPTDDGQRFRARAVEAVEDHQHDTKLEPLHVKFRCSVNDDEYEEIVACNDIIRYIERDAEDGVVWQYKHITSHKGPLASHHPNYKGAKLNVRVEWESGEITAEPLSVVAADDPVSCTIYARDNDLLDMDGWKRFKGIARRQKKLFRMANQVKLRSFRMLPRFKYGIEIPRDYKHALDMDRQDGPTRWATTTALEMEQLDDYDAFIGKGKDCQPPTGYKKIRVHLIYDAKHDGRYKARCVADGQLTDVSVDSVYSGVVLL
jgi:hypothetical protein